MFILDQKFYESISHPLDALETSNSTYYDKLNRVNWSNEVSSIRMTVKKHWQNLSNKIERPIGIFDIRWDDASTDYCIEFDYDFNTNDPAQAMVDGCNMNEPVIDFSAFFKKYLKVEAKNIHKEIKQKDFEHIKDILCVLAKEAIIRSVDDKAFGKLPKQSPCSLMFAKFHDEDAEEFFTSKGTLQSQPKKKNHQGLSHRQLSKPQTYTRR